MSAQQGAAKSKSTTKSKSAADKTKSNMKTLFSLDQLSSLLEMLDANDVREFELEHGDEKLKLKRGQQVSVEQRVVEPVQRVEQPVIVQQSAPQAAEAAPRPAETELQVVQGAKAAAESPSGGHTITSPMVGTFYSRPAPDADAYVKVGDVVSKGTVLCIVEAMKIMNEIEADKSGKVIEICLEDGQMAEYGEALFRIEPS